MAARRSRADLPRFEFRSWQQPLHLTTVSVVRLGEGDTVDADRPGNVLDRLFAQILEAEAELVAHLVVDDCRETMMPPGSASASSRAATLTPSP